MNWSMGGGHSRTRPARQTFPEGIDMPIIKKSEVWKGASVESYWNLTKDPSLETWLN
jgi:hypothetical protein